MNAKANDGITSDLVGNLLVLTFDAPNANNPFSAAMECELTSMLTHANDDDDVRAIILTGGTQRSFSAGGDFNEVGKFEGGAEVDKWIDDVVGMYRACLNTTKPTVGAIDKHAIGIGFQLALCCDYRIGTSRCQLVMPELKNGIACVLGQYMLGRMLGRAQMLRIVIESEPLLPEETLRLGLVNEICDASVLQERAQAYALRLAGYPQVAYRVTKAETNRSFSEGLRKVAEAAKGAHRASFRDRSAQKFMSTILNR